MALVEDLATFVRQHRLRLFDLNLHNLLLQSRPDGSERLVVIDWKSAVANYEAIPISSAIPAVGRRKFARRLSRAIAQIRSLAVPA